MSLRDKTGFRTVRVLLKVKLTVLEVWFKFQLLLVIENKFNILLYRCL